MVGLFGISLVSLSKNWTINSRKDLFRNASQYCSYHNGYDTIKYCKLSKLYRFSLKYILAVRRETQVSWALSVRAPSGSATLTRRRHGPPPPNLSAAPLQLLLLEFNMELEMAEIGSAPLLEVPIAQWTLLLQLISPCI